MFKLSADSDNTQLWTAVRLGDRAAFAHVVEMYYPKLFSYGTKLSKDHESVKDCIQDVFIEIWSRRERLADVQSVLAYLLKSLRRRMARERERNRFSLMDEFDDTLPFDVEFSIETQLITEQTQQDHVRRLNYLLEQLPKRQKEVIYLRYYQQLDYPDIADLMGLSRQTVYNHMNDAIGKLRRYWQESIVTLLLLALWLR